MPNLLLFGYGNPGRGDDALGPRLIERVESLALAQVTCLVDMQLLIEHAMDLSGFDQILFVDADMSCNEPFEFSTVDAKKDESYTSHAITPAALLLFISRFISAKLPLLFCCVSVVIILNWVIC